MAAQRLQGTLVQPSAPIYRDWKRMRRPRGRKKQRKRRTLLRACLASTAKRPRRKFAKPSIPSQGDWTKVAPAKKHPAFRVLVKTLARNEKDASYCTSLQGDVQ